MGGEGSLDYFRRERGCVVSAILQPGDRVRYSTKFLQNIGSHMGSFPMRTGTFASYWDRDPRYARVKWDNFDARWHAQQNGQDYADDAVANGQLVLAVNIEKLP